MSWQEYQEKTYRTKPQYLAVYIINKLEVNSIVDLGCGAGNETVYFLKNGKKVISIDANLNKDYIVNRIGEKEKNNLTLINTNMEKVKLPKTDCIFSVFTLPFCQKEYFNILWQNIYNSINTNGYLVANLFGKRDWHKENHLTFTKEEILKLLEEYEIIKWKEQEYTRDSDNTHWHYFDFIAKKK